MYLVPLLECCILCMGFVLHCFISFGRATWLLLTSTNFLRLGRTTWWSLQISSCILLRVLTHVLWIVRKSWNTLQIRRFERVLPWYWNTLKLCVHILLTCRFGGVLLWLCLLRAVFWRSMGWQRGLLAWCLLIVKSKDVHFGVLCPLLSWCSTVALAADICSWPVLRAFACCELLAPTFGTSGLCKNKQCSGPKGTRRQAQAGCGGYCATCGREFVPELAAKARTRQTQRKGLCADCGEACVQVTDARTGRSLCKPCARVANEHGSQCFLCLAPASSDSAEHCTYMPDCKGVITLCVLCTAATTQRICARCWATARISDCFQCHGPLTTLSKRRICNTCYVYGTRHSCYYCHTYGEDTLMRPCRFQVECKGAVCICEQCVSLHNKVVCSDCFRSAWHGMCFRCNQRLVRRGQAGQFCFDCYSMQYAPAQCYYCGRVEDTMQRQPCTYKDDCNLDAFVCNACQKLHGYVLCKGCYVRYWRNARGELLCYGCAQTKARRGEQRLFLQHMFS